MHAKYATPLAVYAFFGVDLQVILQQQDGTPRIPHEQCVTIFLAHDFINKNGWLRQSLKSNELVCEYACNGFSEVVNERI